MTDRIVSWIQTWMIIGAIWSAAGNTLNACIWFTAALGFIVIAIARDIAKGRAGG